ncbi:hypothetical protein F511_24848 [Dorcoceras hygrometricum]|uniref:Uncharacterized protein n=1 Tax=Dorcoceras hygrometricum TaxID=472368 RepID=A0A2Z7BS71_9LAMI|nr:hypothetical protein F511_24848 [Dorcoceras hygrometricum]
MYGSLPPSSGDYAVLKSGFLQMTMVSWARIDTSVASGQPHQLPQPESRPPFLKQSNTSFSASSQLGTKESVAGITKRVNSNRDESGATTTNDVLPYNAAVAGSSSRNHLSSDAPVKSKKDPPTLSLSLYNLGEGGQKNSPSSSERRHMRMIRNRESASRHELESR